MILRIPYISRLLERERNKAYQTGVQTGLQTGHNAGREEGIRIGQEIQKQSDLSFIESHVTISQTVDLLRRTQLLSKDQIEDVKTMVNSEQYPSFRTYLLRQSLEFFDKSSQAPKDEAHIFSKFALWLKELAIDLETMKRKNDEPTPDDPYA